ncbi:Gfo/Idh/MocA family oxidoreductase, partial [archaeon]|nr:Gfo/Idh/MocA family oxidoreductase [archaeon]
MSGTRIVFVGCGAAVRRYYLPALRKNRPHLEEIYFVDSNPGNAQELQNELGWGQVSGSYGDILDKVHGAVIATPHAHHYRMVLDFLKAGTPVLCEKPLAENLEQASEMVLEARKSNVALCVNNTRRLFPAFREIHRIIGAGELGRPLSIEYIEGNNFAWPSKTGFSVNPSVSSKGILMDIGTHVIDTICWWLGRQPELIDYQDDSYGGPESLVRIKAAAGSCSIRVLLNRLCDLANTYTIICE